MMTGVGGWIYGLPEKMTLASQGTADHPFRVSLGFSMRISEYCASLPNPFQYVAEDVEKVFALLIKRCVMLEYYISTEASGPIPLTQCSG